MGDDIHTPDQDRPLGSSDSAENVSPLTSDFTVPPRADPIADELERQARETIRLVRESAGELGQRVRDVLKRASDYWDDANPDEQGEDAVHIHLAERARALARRWSSRDFLVDPELSTAMSVHNVEESVVWRVDLRERGETRTLGEGTDPYTGAMTEATGPVLPVWEYTFATVPEIQSGERHERLPGTAMVAACTTCHGSGHRPCATCEGNGVVTCPVCHGRSRLLCRRCHGRGRIPDPVAQRRAGASKPYLQIRAERLMSDTGARLADFAERLRQDYGVPLPPSAQWAPAWTSDEESIPCPDCVNGYVRCACGDGKLVCRDCRGTGNSDCAACGGTGRVLRYREVVRRFDTRISNTVLSGSDGARPGWLTDEMLERADGEHIWEGSAQALDGASPDEVPAPVWAAARTIAEKGTSSAGMPAESPAERRVISRQVVLQKIPVTRVEYTFGNQPFSFIAVGSGGSERFWAQEFPTRWARVSRFFAAISRDIGASSALHPSSHVSDVRQVQHIDEFRARRKQSLMRIPIEDDTHQEEKPEDTAPDSPPEML